MNNHIILAKSQQIWNCSLCHVLLMSATMESQIKTYKPLDIDENYSQQMMVKASSVKQHQHALHQQNLKQMEVEQYQL